MDNDDHDDDDYDDHDDHGGDDDDDRHTPLFARSRNFQRTPSNHLKGKSSFFVPTWRLDSFKFAITS